ncbi:MAG: hypothetical protein E6G54_00210 [Actinobacteria bacterium]|nr:MAG: hypothetical protein E6G54_00210 [Actinomycetota bacterium]
MAERVFAMPDLGEGLEEGRIVRWLVAEGATVELNQPLVEVETAKAVVEIPSPFAGKIQALHGSNGEDVPVGRALVTFEVTGGAVAYLDMVSVDQPSSGPVPATPPVRKLAKELGVDIQTVRGTGTHARVTEEDVRSAAEAVNVTGAELTPVRRAIAANLERQAKIPQVTTFRTVDCSALQPFRAELGVSPLPVVVAALTRSGSLRSRRRAAGWPRVRAPAPSPRTTFPAPRSPSPTPALTGANPGRRSCRRARASRSRSASSRSVCSSSKARWPCGRPRRCRSRSITA